MASLGTITVHVEPSLFTHLQDRAESAERERDRLQWEADWLEATGLRCLDVRLDGRYPMLSRVKVAGTDMDIACSTVAISVSASGQPSLSLTIPLDMADVSSHPPTRDRLAPGDAGER